MNKTLTLITTLMLAGCGPDIVDVDASDLEPDDPNVVVYRPWAETRCVETYQGQTTCYGRPMGSENAWVLVVPECKIAAAEILGVMMSIPGWTDETCSPGETPSNFLGMAGCYWITDHFASACFSGGQGWLTQVTPLCDVALGGVDSWPGDLCEGEPIAVGLNPWDGVMCDGAGCMAVDDLDAMRVWPTCWIDKQQPSQPPC